MIYTSTFTSANYRRRSYTEAADLRPRLARARRKNTQPTLPSAAGHPTEETMEALEEIFLASRTKFIRIAYSVLRNKEDAEDAVQDAILSAYLHLRNFEGRAAFTTWFTRIVLNAALMILRKRTRSRIVSVPEPSTGEEIPWIERIPTSEPDPEMVCAEGETLELIDHVLTTMKPMHRQAFTTTYFDELSSAEGSALLGVSTGTFKARLLRARQHLLNRAKRSHIGSIRRATRMPLSFRENGLRGVSGRPTEFSPTEMAFS